MIVEGKPELGLQKHQQDAYKLVRKAYETKNKASVVIPTGCGKSFIALQLMADNKDKRILFMAPTNAIKIQMYDYIAKYIVGEKPTRSRTSRMIAEEYFPSLRIMLYPSLLRIRHEVMDKLDIDIIIMDELHRTGADKWGQRINTLLERNPNAQILGLTATPDRMDDKNVVDELFEGNIDYELSLVEALRDGIIKSPTYVKCDYSLGEYLEGIRTMIANCDNEQKKKMLQDRYNKMRKIVDQADGIPELFAKNIKKKDGKYIIFCKDKAHMDELMKKAQEWFRNIDDEPEMYSVYSGDGYSEQSNKETIKKFENSKSKHIKLLYSIEMLNEGLHVEDISGVIMARPTDSRIIYLQQLGRALSSDISRDSTIIFDLVNNYLKNNLDAEVNRRTKIIRDKGNIESREYEVGGDAQSNDIDIFRIQGETKEFLELLDEIQGITERKGFLIHARNIKQWMEQRETTKPPSSGSKDYEEKRLAVALSQIRYILIKPYMQLKTEDEKAKYAEEHSGLEEILQIINWIEENNIPPYLKNARDIKQWMEQRKTAKPPSTRSKDYEETRLGVALNTIRQQLIKPYIQLETEEEKARYREKRPELEEILQIINWIDENNISPYLRNARDIKEWMQQKETTKPPVVKTKDNEEKKLGIALSAIRQQLIKPYMQLETEEEKARYREKHQELEEILQIINWIDENNISPYLKNARDIEQWLKQQEKARMPSDKSDCEEERRLATVLNGIRYRMIRPYLMLQTEEEKAKYREKHPELDEILLIMTELDMHCGNKKQRELANLIRQDLEKRKLLQEAKKLEQKYEQQLLIEKGQEAEGTLEQGVDFDE